MLYWILIIGALYFSYKLTHQNKNDVDKYYKQYMHSIIKTKTFVVKHIVKDNLEDAMKDNIGSNYESYKKGSIGYKGLFGKIYSYTFLDSISKKYYRIYIIDDTKGIKSSCLKSQIENRQIFVFVNKDDLANFKYGTKENPVPVFNYKGIEKPLIISVGNDNHMSLEPTQQEYEHNVITYLTYIMPKEEFERRFGK